MGHRRCVLAGLAVLVAAGLLLLACGCKKKTKKTIFIAPVPGIVAQQDASVLESEPDVPHGSMAGLSVGIINVGDPGADGEIHSYLKFDLSSIPAGATIDSVELQIRVTFCLNSLGAGFNIGVYEVDGPWAEKTIMWNGRPSVTYRAQVTGPADEFKGWFSIAVPELITMVEGWLAAPATNNGLALLPEFASTFIDGMDLGSRESSFRPNLVVEYTEP